MSTILLFLIVTIPFLVAILITRLDSRNIKLLAKSTEYTFGKLVDLKKENYSQDNNLYVAKN